MDVRSLKSMQKKLFDFVEDLKPLLGRTERRHWCSLYLSGLMLDGERKSIEPMSKRFPGGNEQAMQQFVNQSPWEHEPVQDFLIDWNLEKQECTQGVLLLDDTSLPKKGKHSVGVSRQYCGALGKIANCQSIVSWHYAEKKLHFPLVGELYLPKSWTEDKARMKQSGVPEVRFKFKKKWELALDLLDGIKDKVSYEVIVTDAGYGEIREFLGKLDEREEPFIAQIPESHSFWPITTKLNNKQNHNGRPRKYPEIADNKAKAFSAKKWAEKLSKKKWISVTLPLKKRKKVNAMAIRVYEAVNQAHRRPGPERWLIFIQEKSKLKYFVSNLPAKTSLKQMVLWAGERWKIEQGYQNLKDELGFDHFEGRSWRGLHHHLTLCFMAYSFLLMLKKESKKKSSFIPSRQNLVK